MSLELKIEALTAAVQALTTQLATAAAAPAMFGGEVAAPKGTRGKKADATPPAGIAETTVSDDSLVPGDEKGTRYWVIEAHSTVYKQGPSDPEVNVASATPASAAVYLQKKEEFEKKGRDLLAAAQTGAAAASTDSSPKPSESAASGATFKDVVDALTKLNASDKPGHGRAGVKALVEAHLPVGSKVPALEALKKNDALLAEINALLTPAAATDENLFG